MNEACTEERQRSRQGLIDATCWRVLENAIECRAILCPEEDGGFSAIVRDLPGAVSQGDTEDEALANLREAFAGLVVAYRDSNQPIPFCARDPAASIAGCKHRWILVNV